MNSTWTERCRAYWSQAEDPCLVQYSQRARELQERTFEPRNRSGEMQFPGSSVPRPWRCHASRFLHVVSSPSTFAQPTDHQYQRGKSTVLQLTVSARFVPRRTCDMGQFGSCDISHCSRLGRTRTARTIGHFGSWSKFLFLWHRGLLGPYPRGAPG